MVDAVKALRQNMKQEAPDELVGGKRHDALALVAGAAVVLEAESDTRLVQRDQSPVRDGDAVRVRPCTFDRVPLRAAGRLPRRSAHWEACEADGHEAG